MSARGALLSLTIHSYLRWLCPAFGKPHSQLPNLRYLHDLWSCLCQTSGKKQRAKCLWPEFLEGEAIPLRSCKEFWGWQESWWPLTRCFTLYLACEHAYEWEKQIAGGHLVVLLLIFWNQALAAVRCKVCCSSHADTVRGVLWSCWILGITAESFAPRATDHAACPLWEWDSIALWPARLRLCSSFSLSQVSYASLLHLCSLYLPFSRSNFIPPIR